MNFETTQAPDAAIAAVIHSGSAAKQNYGIRTQAQKGHQQTS
jgi:hypothetical protein